MIFLDRMFKSMVLEIPLLLERRRILPEVVMLPFMNIQERIGSRKEALSLGIILPTFLAGM